MQILDCVAGSRIHIIGKGLQYRIIGNHPPLIIPMPSKPSGRRVHFTPIPSNSVTGGIGGTHKWKPSFITTNMFRGKPEKLTRQEAAKVDAQLSIDVECMCCQLHCRTTTHRWLVFDHLDHDRACERDEELPASEYLSFSFLQMINQHDTVEDIITVYERYKDSMCVFIGCQKILMV